MGRNDTDSCGCEILLLRIAAHARFHAHRASLRRRPNDYLTLACCSMNSDTNSPYCGFLSLNHQQLDKLCVCADYGLGLVTFHLATLNLYPFCCFCCADFSLSMAKYYFRQRTKFAFWIICKSNFAY